MLRGKPCPDFQVHSIRLRAKHSPHPIQKPAMDHFQQQRHRAHQPKLNLPDTKFPLRPQGIHGSWTARRTGEQRNIQFMFSHLFNQRSRPINNNINNDARMTIVKSFEYGWQKAFRRIIWRTQSNTASNFRRNKLARPHHGSSLILYARDPTKFRHHGLGLQF